MHSIYGLQLTGHKHGSNSSDVPINDSHLCKAILYTEIRDTSIRIWDFMIFVPNLTFLIYLLWHFRVSRERVRQLNNFPILRNFYIFIYLCVSVSMMRCFVSIVMKVNTTGGDLIDKIFWVIVRFFLLSTEISVLVFGLFAGHLDVRQSIRRILSITLIVSLVYSICQGTFEIIAPDVSFYIGARDYYLFGHGGMIFWFCTCIVSFLVYSTVVLLPWSPCRNRLLLPTKPSFYMYAVILAMLNFVQAIGALLFYLNIIEGLCILDATTYLYFTLFTPLVYLTFLSPFLAVGSSTSAASALVTTTAGSEAFAANSYRQSAVPLSRPNNLFASGMRGAVNFSYRPQLDDELLTENEDELAQSIGSIGGLHFDNFGPYTHNNTRQGYLVYESGGTIPRNFSSYSIQTTTAQDVALLSHPTTTDTSIQHRNGVGNKWMMDTKRLDPIQTSTSGSIRIVDSSKDSLLESHMLQEQKQLKTHNLSTQSAQQTVIPSLTTPTQSTNSEHIDQMDNQIDTKT